MTVVFNQSCNGSHSSYIKEDNLNPLTTLQRMVYYLIDADLENMKLLVKMLFITCTASIQFFESLLSLSKELENEKELCNFQVFLTSS